MIIDRQGDALPILLAHGTVLAAMKHHLANTDATATSSRAASGASQALLSAAIAGLLAGAGSACAPEAQSGGEGMITASRTIPNLSLEQFSLDCEELGGVVELHAHCGGVNTCRGFSYDDVTQVLTEHTCRALNTCSGFSCVIPEDEG